MKRLCLILVCALALPACAHRIPDLPPVPTGVVQQTEQDVKAGAAKALEALIAADRFANTLSQVETDASQHGLPAEIDRTFDALLRQYVAASRQAGENILRGVQSWAALKAALDPVRAQAQRLIDYANSVLITKDQFSAFLQQVKDAIRGMGDSLSVSLGEYLFGGAR